MADPAHDPERQDALPAQLSAIARNPWGVIRRRWLQMLPALLVALAGAAAIPFLIAARYEATATVLVSSQQIPEEFVRSTVSGLDSLANVNALMGEMLSQRRLSAIISKYDLYPDQREKRSLADVIADMRSAIGISQQRNINGPGGGSSKETASIFTLTYSYTDAVNAAAVTNELANIFVEASLAKRSEQARITTEFLKRELKRADAELRDVSSAIADFRQANRGAMPDDLEGILQKLERLELQRQTLSVQISDAEAKLSRLERESQLQSEDEAALTELRMQLAADLAVLTEEHPDVIALRGRIDRMEEEMSEVTDARQQRERIEQDRIDQTQEEIERLRTRLANTEAETVELDRRVTLIPDNQETFEALENRSAVLRENYVEFMRKVQEAELAETLEAAQQGPRVSVLDPAVAPDEPTRSVHMMTLLGVVVAFGMAAAVGLLMELLDPVVLGTEHLEATHISPLLGSVRELA